jgi:formylglycine-generating enzyme required for sulfatase activity/predicted Ser/Thr protein kinase
MPDDSDKTLYREGSAEAVYSNPSVSSKSLGFDDLGGFSSDAAACVGSVLKQRFVLEEEIGRGGMGTVYRARDLRKEEAQDRYPFVAIKLLGDAFRHHPDALKQMQREARKAQKLAHPNIAQVFDFDRDGPNVFIVMELLEGESLDKSIARAGPMGSRQIESIVRQICIGVGYAHELGVIHLDLKPANVFLQRDGRVKLLDFGIARACEGDRNDDVEGTRFDAGTLRAVSMPYATVEMLAGIDPEPRDDVYALACIAYELLSGRHPFARQSAHAAQEHELRAKRPRQASRRQWQAIKRGLEFNSRDRTASAAQFLREFSGRDFPYVSLVLVSALVAVASVGFPFLSKDKAIDERPANASVAAVQPNTEAQSDPRLSQGVYAPATQFIKPATAPSETEQKAITLSPRGTAEEIGVSAEKAKSTPPAALSNDRLRTNEASIRDAIAREGLVFIRGGRFEMGSLSSEEGRYDDEGPTRIVQVEAFVIAAREVSRAEYEEFVSETNHAVGSSCWIWSGREPIEVAGASWSNPGFQQTDSDPAVCVSWLDAQAYASWKARRSGIPFRLPTEAEWEFAARAGTRTSRFWSDNPNFACRYANVLDNTARRTVVGTARWTGHLCDDRYAYTSPAATFLPNSWGLFDMLGNAWEWTQDCYHASYDGAPIDGKPWIVEGCTHRVARGGSWNFGPKSVRAAARVRASNDVRNNVTGFRLAADLPR